MTGTSPVNFARNKRLNRPKFSRKGKGLNSNSPVSNIFRTQLIKTGDATLTINNVEDLINDPKFASASNITAAEEKDRSLLQRQWAKSHKLTPLQLLDTLRLGIAAEEHMLRFDYISLHLRCLRLLRTLQTIVDDVLHEVFGTKPIENESQLVLVVFYIFELSDTSEKTLEILKLKSGSESPILKRASEVVQEFIEIEGSVECDRLQETCVWGSRQGGCAA